MFTYPIVGPKIGVFLTSEYVLGLHTDNKVYYTSVDHATPTYTTLGSTGVYTPAPTWVTSEGSYIYINGNYSPALRSDKWTGSVFSQVFNDAISGLSNGLDSDTVYLPQLSTGHVFTTGAEAFGYGISAVPFTAGAGVSGGAVSSGAADSFFSKIMDFRSENNGKPEYGDLCVGCGNNGVVFSWTGSAFTLHDTLSTAMSGGHAMAWDRDTGDIIDVEVGTTSVTVYSLDLDAKTLSLVGSGSITGESYAGCFAGGYFVSYEYSNPNRYLRTYTLSGTTLTQVDELSLGLSLSSNVDLVTSPLTDIVYTLDGTFKIGGDGGITALQNFAGTGNTTTGIGNQVWFLSAPLPEL